jgi:hypothetical protein
MGVGDFSMARDLLDETVEVTTSKVGPEARQDALDQAVEQVTERLTEEILGAEKKSKYWANLRPKLKKSSTRFVISIKGSQPVQTGATTKISVSMRVSPDNLETLLREEGVLSSGDIRILPLIAIVDARGIPYTWWTDFSEDGKPNPLEEPFKKFLVQMQNQLKGKGPVLVDPTSSSFKMGVPSVYRVGALRREDQLLLAQFLKADVVLTGKIESARLRTENMDLKLIYDLQMFQSRSGRSISEVLRTEPLTSDQIKVVSQQMELVSPKVIQTLVGPLLEATTSGSLNLNVVRIEINGSMNYKQGSELKRLISQLRDVRALRERWIESGRVVYEAEASVSGQDLAKVIEKSRFPDFRVEVSSSRDDGLALSVKALR